MSRVLEQRGSGYFQVGDDIEMDEEFAGNVSSLPACPQTRADGWCRRTSDGQPMKTAPWLTTTTTAAPSVSGGMSTTTKVAIAGAGLLALYLFTR